MPDGLPAGLDASADPIGTAPSMNSLMTPTKQETELQQEAISTGKEAASRLKSSAAMGTDLAKHLGEAPDPEKFGLSADDLHRAEPSKPPQISRIPHCKISEHSIAGGDIRWPKSEKTSFR